MPGVEKEFLNNYKNQNVLILGHQHKLGDNAGEYFLLQLLKEIKKTKMNILNGII